jgi:plastocyanin
MPIRPDNTDGPYPSAVMTVQDENPSWVFCRQTYHCQRGMVFAVNPGEKFETFKARAMANSNSSGTIVADSTSTTTMMDVPTSSVTVLPTSFSAGASTSSIVSGAPRPTGVATSHWVVVGGVGAQLVFSPTNITAALGDTITFEFHQTNHSVVASSFTAPCTPLSQSDSGATASGNGTRAFDSGFYPVGMNAALRTFPTFKLEVRDTELIWAFCAQSDHCGKGMVFSANAPATGERTHVKFLENAKRVVQNATMPTSGAEGTMLPSDSLWTWATFLTVSLVSLQ